MNFKFDVGDNVTVVSTTSNKYGISSDTYSKCIGKSFKITERWTSHHNGDNWYKLDMDENKYCWNESHLTNLATIELKSFNKMTKQELLDIREKINAELESRTGLYILLVNDVGEGYENKPVHLHSDQIVADFDTIFQHKQDMTTLFPHAEYIIKKLVDL